MKEGEQTDHRIHMLVRLHHALHQYRFVVVVLQELLHLRGQFARVVHADSVDAHRLGELDEVGVRHARMRVALFVEQVCGTSTRKQLLQGEKKRRVSKDEPCHCRTMPWNSLLRTMTLTPMLYCDAVASSIAVMLNEASPSMSTTILFGAATLAPTADGRPKPMV